ncbi:MAG: hypothetical protein M1305_07245 [Candidatus Marsarchaeota archaeon]|nr:hypothetical protein [Candidatus Marsarchaeota archaeon]
MTTESPPQKPNTDDFVRDVGDWLTRTDRFLLVSLALLVVGLLGAAIFQSGFFWLLFWIGFLLLVLHALGCGLHFRFLGQDQLIDQWATLISNAKGRPENVIRDTERLMDSSDVPDAVWKRQDISPGLIRGLLGTTRSFLVISNTTNPNLRPYRMYINARDYGINLQISWYLVEQPSTWQKLMTALLYVPILGFAVLPFYLIGRLTTAKQAGLLGLDIFDEQDLRAFVTNAHHCLLDAVQRLMLDLGQDPSRIDPRSRGFLGIS